jgi:hypothetical protein
LKRVHYFDHQFLRAVDMNFDQAYHVSMRRLHNSLLHTWGIASLEGLKVKFEGGATAVTVTAGTAIDSLGQEIVLTEDSGPIELSSFDKDADVYIVVSYLETESDPSAETGVEGNTRVTEQPKLEPLTSTPRDLDTRLVLGKVQRKGTEVVGVDESDRRLAGAAGGALDVLEVGLRDPKIQSTSWVRLSLEKPGTAIASGSLHVTGDLTVDGAVGIGRTLAVRGVFTASALAVTDDQGKPYPGNGIGMSAGVDGPSKWLSINGINDAGARRLTLQADIVHVPGKVGIGFPKPAAGLDVAGGLRTSGITFSDPNGTTYKDAWVGMANNFGDSAQWLHIGGITAEGGARRLGLVATYLYLSGNVGINRLPRSDRPLCIGDGELHVGGKSGGFSFGDRDTTGDIEDLDKAKRRYVLYSHGGNATLWNSGDRLQISPDGNMTFLGNNSITTRRGMLMMGTTDGSTAGKFEVVAGIGFLGYGQTHGQFHYKAGWGFEFRDSSATVPSLNPTGQWANVATGSLVVNGSLTATGGKGGYIVERFVNAYDDTLEEGDVIVIAEDQSDLSYGERDAIPIPEADIASQAYDRRVCGIVSEVHGEVTEIRRPGAKRGRSQKRQATTKIEARSFTPDELEEIPTEQVQEGQIGTMVTLGAYATCKVDASYGAIKPGDLLTTSPTKGHAQKVLDPAQAVGAILGKALGSRTRGQGKIPVLVLLQ